MHGDIGYKFYWLLPSEDHNQGTPAGHKSNGTTVKDHWENMNQLRHQLGMNHNPYRYGLRQNQNWTIITNMIGYDLSWKPNKKTAWLIVQV